MRLGIFLFLLISFGLEYLQAQDFLKKLITKSPGPLSTAHQEYDSIKGCVSCHANTLGGEVANQKCVDCHKEIGLRLEKYWGYHADKENCESCHSEHKGSGANIFAPDGWLDKFQHEEDTGFALVGKHAKVECNDCHTEFRSHYKTKQKTTSRSYLDAPTNCIGCHERDYLHDFDRKDLEDCSQCHSTHIDDWKSLRKPLLFNHDTSNYKLEGLHAAVICIECHEPDPKSKRVTKFKPLDFNQCIDCHADPHKGSFGNNCTSCHSVYRKWDRILISGDKAQEGFDHNKTRFPLVGFHEAVACESCHYREDKSFKLPDDEFDQCSDCHGFPHGEQFKDQKCESCHSQDRQFFNSTFDLERHAKTKFPLDGKHLVIDCQRCHYSGQYEELAFAECSDCHRDVHPERQIDKTCSFCHVTTSFSWIQFDHNKNTDFSLTGKHREVACLSCHVEQIFKNMPATNENPNCQSCHADPHGPAMPNDCQNCHRTEGFKLVRNFDHEEIGKWKLTGRHSELSCQKCHADHLLKNYEIKVQSPAALASDCVNCHIDVHKSEFGNQCQSCHSSTTFEIEYGEKVHDLGFFRLEGTHDQMDCGDCHSTGTNLQGTGEACGWCHAADDIHLGQFSSQCGDCHAQTSWLPTKFRHNQTAFRLTGAHRYVECSACHVNNIFQGLPNDCYFCHSDSFVKYIDLHQNQSGRNVAECSDCHTTIDWHIRRGASLE